MIEVFKTNVQDKNTADNILMNLKLIFPSSNINFDLEDCDKILRVESKKNIFERVIHLIIGMGYNCEVLED